MTTDDWKILHRRAFVTVGLLTLPSLFTWLFSSLQPFTVSTNVVAHLAWGASCYHASLGFWLVSRAGLFSSALGWFRTCFYLGCAFYGWMCGSAVQDWSAMNMALRVPGSDIRHFAAAIMDSLDVLTFVWLLLPIHLVLRRRLTDDGANNFRSPQATVASTLLWVGLASTILMALRVLTLHGKRLQIAMAYERLTEVGARFAFGHWPINFVDSLALVVIAIGVSGNLRYGIFALLAALTIQFSGEQAVISLCAMMKNDVFKYSVLTSPVLDRISFFIGNVFIVFATMTFARLTGLRYVRAQMAATGCSEFEDDATECRHSFPAGPFAT